MKGGLGELAELSKERRGAKARTRGVPLDSRIKVPRHAHAVCPPVR